MTVTQMHHERWLVWLVRCCLCGFEAHRATERRDTVAAAKTAGWHVERFLALCPRCKNLPAEAQP